VNPMFCENCGKQIDEGVKFCKFCGVNVSSGPGQSNKIKKCPFCKVEIGADIEECPGCHRVLREKVSSGKKQTTYNPPSEYDTNPPP